jgi:hypothetical protein
VSDRIWSYVDASWRVLLGIAVTGFGAAAVATDAGANAFARFAGTTAWSCAVVGVIAGIVAEVRRVPE